MTQHDNTEIKIEFQKLRNIVYIHLNMIILGLSYVKRLTLIAALTYFPNLLNSHRIYLYVISKTFQYSDLF